MWALAFFYIVGAPPFGIFFSELFILKGMIHSDKWYHWWLLALFLSLLMVIFIGMGRSVLRMLQTPGETPPSATANRERFNLSHALGLYAASVSIPLILFRPAALFDALHSIMATLGTTL